ncbi:ribonuclease P protein component [Aquihabitans daechungensis]|uniref:ribonuclease P protein component n=1 Tax=Aquihabitans daechungensis TaxID=1052257 RepID=UPI003BA3CD6C
MIGPVRDRRTFVALRARGIRVRRGPLALTFLAEDDASGTRVAYAITKRVGGAVERNRLRRRLRALFADLAAEASGSLPDGVLLVSAGPEASGRDPEELRNDVMRLLAALEARRFGGEAP